MRRLALVAATAMLLTTATIGTATAAPPTVVRVPLVISSDGLDDIASCVGEEVEVTGGEFQIVAKDDLTHPYVFHRNVSGGRVTGLDTGTVYRVQGHLQDAANMGTFTETYVLKLKTVSPGDGPNFAADALIHLTFNGQGDLVFEVWSFDVTCG